ncbi:hypothetical protein HDU76_011368 [Blyttiomyces sp. JEL0837]|nr:hypothetical protein HDU76_011368 [Blyttiomyces sp. JEL0837]
MKDLKHVKSLNLWGQNLSDVSILKNLPDLQVLSLAVNNIRDLSAFSGIHSLRELYLRKNQISDPRQLFHLCKLPLVSLWIEDNPVCARIPNYRVTMFRIMPTLKKLDDVDMSDRERREVAALGPVRPDELLKFLQSLDQDPGFFSDGENSATARPPQNQQRPAHGVAQTQSQAQSHNNVQSHAQASFNRHSMGPIVLDGQNGWSKEHQHQMDMRKANRRSVDDLRFEDHLVGNGLIQRFEHVTPNGQIQRLVGQKLDTVGGWSGASEEQKAERMRRMMEVTADSELHPQRNDHLQVGSGMNIVRVPYKPHSKVPTDHELHPQRNEHLMVGNGLNVVKMQVNPQPRLATDHELHPPRNEHLQVGEGLNVVRMQFNPQARIPSDQEASRRNEHLNVGDGLNVVQMQYNPQARITFSEPVGMGISRHGPPEHLDGAAAQVAAKEEQHVENFENMINVGRPPSNSQSRRPNWLSSSDPESIVQSIREASKDNGPIVSLRRDMASNWTFN